MGVRRLIVTSDVKRWDLICHEGLITYDAVRKEKLDQVNVVMPAPRNKTERKDINLAMPRYYWAKTTKDNRPGISVRDHCLNVGCVAEALLNLLPRQLRNLLPPSAATLAALHNIGKVSPGFQQKCPAWLGEHGLSVISTKENWPLCETHHGKVTAFALRDYFKSRWGDDSWDDVAHCVGAHHGTLFGKLFVKQPKKDPTAWAAQARRELIEELERVLGDFPKRPARLLDSDLWYLAGLITVADWIQS